MTPPEINGRQLSDLHEQNMIEEDMRRKWPNAQKQLEADEKEIRRALKEARYKRTVKIKKHVLP